MQFSQLFNTWKLLKWFLSSWQTCTVFQLIKITIKPWNYKQFEIIYCVFWFCTQLKSRRNFGLSSSRWGLFCIFSGRVSTFMMTSWPSSNSFSPIAFFTRSLQALSFGRPSNTFRPVATGYKTHSKQPQYTQFFKRRLSFKNTLVNL